MTPDKNGKVRLKLLKLARNMKNQIVSTLVTLAQNRCSKIEIVAVGSKQVHLAGKYCIWHQKRVQTDKNSWLNGVASLEMHAGSSR